MTREVGGEGGGDRPPTFFIETRGGAIVKPSSETATSNQHNHARCAVLGHGTAGGEGEGVLEGEDSSWSTSSQSPPPVCSLRKTIYPRPTPSPILCPLPAPRRPYTTIKRHWRGRRWTVGEKSIPGRARRGRVAFFLVNPPPPSPPPSAYTKPLFPSKLVAQRAMHACLPLTQCRSPVQDRPSTPTLASVERRERWPSKTLDKLRPPPVLPATHRARAKACPALCPPTWRPWPKQGEKHRFSALTIFFFPFRPP